MRNRSGKYDAFAVMLIHIGIWVHTELSGHSEYGQTRFLSSHDLHIEDSI